MLALNDVIDVVVEGGTIDGNKARNPNGTLLGIAVLGQCQRVRLLNINIRNCPADKDGGQRGDGIYIGCKAGTGKIPNDVLLHGIVSEGNVRQGLSVVAGRGIKISACSFVNTRGRTPGMGIDLEPNSPIDACENIIITGCYLAGNGGGGIQVTKGARTVNITSNTIDCSPDAYPGLKSPEAYAIGLGNNTGEGIVIQGNTIAGSLAGISVGGGKGVVINGNHIARAKMGVHLYGDSHTVTGNVLSQCWMAGIKVQAHRVVITGNIVHDCGDGRCRDSFPVLVNDGWKEGLFSGNLVRESGREDAPTIGVRLPRQREAAWMAALNQIIGYTRPAD